MADTKQVARDNASAENWSSLGNWTGTVLMNWLHLMLLVFILNSIPIAKANSDSASAATAKIQERRIDFYLEYAFSRVKILKKFKHQPSISLICLDGSCGNLAKKLIAALPPNFDLKLATTHESDFSIMLFNGVQQFERAYTEIDLSVSQESTVEWGNANCRAKQMVTENTIHHLFIYANPDEGERNNLICFASEFLKGSGGSIQGSYDAFKTALSDGSEKDFQVFMRTTSGTLRFQWSTLVGPGSTYDETRSSWRKHYGLPY